MAKDVDSKRVIELASKGYTIKEIAALEDVSESTISHKFAEQVKRGHSIMCGSLRRKQYEVAESGNPTMLIWLGKQYLGQSDKNEVISEERGKLNFGDLPIPASTDAGSTHRPN